jgi:hypothetical protein
MPTVGLEPTASGFASLRSILLSYMGASDDVNKGMAGGVTLIAKPSTYGVTWAKTNMTGCINADSIHREEGVLPFVPL